MAAPWLCFCWTSKNMVVNFKYLNWEAHKNGVPLPVVQFMSPTNICTITIQIRDGTPSYLKGIKKAFV